MFKIMLGQQNFAGIYVCYSELAVLEFNIYIFGNYAAIPQRPKGGRLAGRGYGATKVLRKFLKPFVHHFPCPLTGCLWVS